MSERRTRNLSAAVSAVLLLIVVVGLLTGAPVQRDRSRDLALQLRCPVCQGESVAASSSATAVTIKEQIDEMVAAGDSDAEIRDHYVARYGTWILLSPPTRGPTLLLWVLPGVAAVVGGALVVSRRWRAGAGAVDIDDSERDRLTALVADVRRADKDAAT